jgi:hypothetical protein
VFVIDEWDWIYLTYGKEAVNLLLPLIKVGAELRIQVLLIGQSPLSGDTGLSQSSYHNMVRVAIWQEGQRLLRDYPLDKKYKAPLMARYEQLKDMAPQFLADTKQELRYCTVVPMAGNPTVEVIPFLSDPQSITADIPKRAAKPTPEERKILIPWWKIKDTDFSATDLHKKIRPELTSKPSKVQLNKYRDTIRKFGYDPGF